MGSRIGSAPYRLSPVSSPTPQLTPGGLLVRVAIVFPGQGTQEPGMGAPWREHPAWKIVEQAEAALGEPLAPLLLDAPAEQLARTREAQLAVLCTSLVAWEAARPMLYDVVAFEPVAFAAPHTPVVSNHDGAAYSDGAGWRARLADHVTVPVRWRASMETLAALGASAFVEAGHGSMIAGVAKRTVPNIRVL